MTQKNIFKSYRLLIIVIGIMVSGCNITGQTLHDPDGFVQIFDGRTLTGWEGDPAYWRVENGCLVGEITPDKLLKSNSFIIWRGGRTADFELRLEYRITQSGNSGINYRSVELKDVPHALKGYQSDIDGKNRYTGQNYEERARTTLAYRGEKVIINATSNRSDSLKNHIINNAWTIKNVIGSLGNPDS
ncbi:MAG TPA: DUF1080 domain-containing protein, partial [Flavitalea sp.]|nr:DUF1080 domain-containing protein [Flavitalea sp.]